jgi:Domain of unknown function (DUF6647)
MEALLTAIVVWLSANYSLPASYDHPRVEFSSATKMTSPLRTDDGSPQKPGMVLNQPESDIVSLYSNKSKTIFMRDGWTGKTPAELSILVHEMVHHLQNVGQLQFACPEEREELAYKAQDQWLGLFGHDLLHDFDMDAFTIAVKSKCFN